MMKFDNVQFRYDPYPIGFSTNILPAAFYSELADAFPRTEDLRRASNMGDNKYLLTEFDTDRYFSIIDKSAPWRRLYDYIKSAEFVHQTLKMLCDAGIDQGLRGIDVASASHYDSAVDKVMGKITRNLKQLPLLNRNAGHGHLTSRFEFSAIQGNVGSHLPHTDAPRKVVSMVLSMMREGEWNPSWGGGTAVCKPKDMSKSFNYMNKYMPFEEVDVLDTYPFVPNGCVVFVKTFNSWHTVMPYAAPPEVVRKSIVINIDYPQALGAQQAGY